MIQKKKILIGTDFWNDNPDPNEPHQLGECMEDLYGIVNCRHNRKEIWGIFKMVLDNFSDYCMN